MIKQLVKDIYYAVPYSWRVPGVYHRTSRLINTPMDREEIEKWQLCKLKETVKNAYDNVPGYNQLYNEAGIKPEDIISLADIKLLPLVDKELLRENIKDFTARNVPQWKQMQARTSGSSGIPFTFHRTLEEEWIEHAFVAKAWSNGGWSLDQSGIMLRGAYVGDALHISKKCDNGSFYIHNGSYMLSPNYLTDEYYNVYIEFLKSHSDLVYFFALPSSITLLSQLIIKHHDDGISGIKAIYLSSESIFDWQYNYIRKAFPSARIISLYGQTERVIMAYWCPDNQKYHVDPFYGFTEVLNDNKDVAEEECGELVGTSFWNLTNPFIRYRTKDFAVKGRKVCDSCGKPYDILDRIDGRLQDVLVGKGGRFISIATFDGSLESSEIFKDVLKFRIIQKEVGKLTMLIQTVPGFTQEQKDEFERVIREYLGSDFEFELTRVDDLKPGPNGKYKSVEQYLDIDINSRIRI